MEKRLKTGTKVRLKGTKSVHSSWREMEGLFGVKKGQIVTINYETRDNEYTLLETKNLDIDGIWHNDDFLPLKNINGDDIDG